MGMAAVHKKKVRAPTCKGTVVCPCCDAEYSPNTEWCKGYRKAEGTEHGTFTKSYYIPLGVCPVCETVAR